MNRLLPLLLTGALLISSFGCGLTPRKQWVLQREAITLAQDGMVHLNQNGRLSDNAYLLAEPWIKSARTMNWEAYFYLTSDPDRAVEIMGDASELVSKSESLASVPAVVIEHPEFNGADPVFNP